MFDHPCQQLTKACCLYIFHGQHHLPAHHAQGIYWMNLQDQKDEGPQPPQQDGEPEGPVAAWSKKLEATEQFRPRVQHQQPRAEDSKAPWREARESTLKDWRCWSLRSTDDGSQRCSAQAELPPPCEPPPPSTISLRPGCKVIGWCHPPPGHVFSQFPVPHASHLLTSPQTLRGLLCSCPRCLLCQSTIK